MKQKTAAPGKGAAKGGTAGKPSGYSSIVTPDVKPDTLAAAALVKMFQRNHGRAS